MPETRYAFSTYGGIRVLAATSELFAANELDFGITDDDFRISGYGFEFDFAVLPRVDISIGFDTADAETSVPTSTSCTTTAERSNTRRG